MALCDEFRYMNCHRDVFELISKNDIETFKKRYPDLKDTVPLFRLINDILKSINTCSIDLNDYSSVINISNDLIPFYKNIANEKELLKIVYYNTRNFYDYFLLLFNPEHFKNIPRLAVFPMARLFSFKIDDLSIIKSNRIKLLFEKIDECRIIMNDNVMIVLLLYGFINNNYDALNKYLDNYEFFKSKYYFDHNEGPEEFSLVSDEVITMFEDMDNYLPTQNIVIM